MNKRLLIILAAVMAMSAATFAQSRKALKINEVMVENNDNYVDEFGARDAWIELFNSSFAPLEISSVYITTDRSNIDNPEKTKMYPVPIGDVNTEIAKRQFVVFFADGKPNRGTFHTDFVLVPGQDNWIGIFDADGKTIIDSVTVPASLPANASYGRIVDGKDGKNGEPTWKVFEDNSLSITPSGANSIRSYNDKVENFAEKDPNGVSMAVMAMCIVFSALLLLCVCFYFISKIGEKRAARRKMESQGIDTKNVALRDLKADADDSGEVMAAIVMALHEHLNAHDQESTILTIKKLRRAYSPWNSKIYGLREIPSLRRNGKK